MWVFYTYFTVGLGKIGMPCYNEDFVFLIKYFSPKHYSFNRSTFASQRILVAFEYGIKIVRKLTVSEVVYYL